MKEPLALFELPAPKALGSWAAAIRETFEEVGILFAYDRNRMPVSFSSDEEKARFQSYRRKMCEGKITMAGMLREGLALAADRLHYFSHWITPEPLPLRYDVRFFIAVMPECQSALPRRG